IRAHERDRGVDAALRLPVRTEEPVKGGRRTIDLAPNHPGLVAQVIAPVELIEWRPVRPAVDETTAGRANPSVARRELNDVNDVGVRVVVGENCPAEVLTGTLGAQVPSHCWKREMEVRRVSPLIEWLRQLLLVRRLPRDVAAILRPCVREELAIAVRPGGGRAIGSPAELGLDAGDGREHRPWKCALR